MSFSHSSAFFLYYLLVAFLFQQVYWCSQFPPTLLCDQLEREGKWIKTAGEYLMGFKVPTHKEAIGDPLDKYSINPDISPQPLFIKGEREIRLLL